MELEQVFKILILMTFKEHGLGAALAIGIALLVVAILVSFVRECFKNLGRLKRTEQELSSNAPVTQNTSVGSNSLDRSQDFHFCKFCEQRAKHIEETCASCRAWASSKPPSIKDPLPSAAWVSDISDAARSRLLPRLCPEPYQYGLTLERWHYFHDEKATESWTFQWFIFFLVAAWIFKLLGAPGWVFLAVLFLYIPAAIIDPEVRKAMSRLRNRRRESQADYQDYLRYEGDCEKYYQGLHLLKLEEQKAQLREQQLREEELRRRESWWQQLSGTDFEMELAALLAKRGFEVKHTGGRGDDGVDLIISAVGKTVAIQCKAHAACIGPGPVRELYGSLIHIGADEAWLVTTSDFSLSAREFARNKPLRLLTIREILNRPDASKSAITTSKSRQR